MPSIWQARRFCAGSGCAWAWRRGGARRVSGSASHCSERFRAVEGEDAARAGVGIALVAEEGFDAGGLVEERQRPGLSAG